MDCERALRRRNRRHLAANFSACNDCRCRRCDFATGNRGSSRCPASVIRTVRYSFKPRLKIAFETCGVLKYASRRSVGLNGQFLSRPLRMKTKALPVSSYFRSVWQIAVLTFAFTLPMAAAGSLNQGITPANVLAIMERVADWQLAHPSAHSATDWTQAAGDAGMMALAGISGNPKYRDALFAMGEANGWKPGPRVYHADDLAIGQAYAGLYFLYRDPKMIMPLRARLEAILSAPPKVESLDFISLTTRFPKCGPGAIRCSWPQLCGCRSSRSRATSAISILQ